ncbi:MAG: hypothetical protein AAF993_19255 [Pseudomonadota bacterium]
MAANAAAYDLNAVSRAGLVANLRIVEVDEKPVADLPEFITAVAAKAHGANVRLRVLDMQNTARLLTLKVDNNYWPPYQLQRDQGVQTDRGDASQWRRLPVLAPSTKDR